MKRRVLVLDVHSGISGDMFVAAAAALAGCENEVCSLPGKLGLERVTCVFRDVSRGSIRCRKFDVMVGELTAEEAACSQNSFPEDGDLHDHYHPHGHNHPHVHDDPNSSGHPQPHEHRSLSSIRKLIVSAELDERVEARALRMFDRLGEVEACAHGIPVEQVHFHEVGAVDSIIDIVAAALCIERLGVVAAYASSICVGSGTVQTAHGILPVPAPATERLLRGMPTTVGELSGEWTTPTGALILGELGVNFHLPTLVTLDAAFGGGTRNPPRRPSVLRLRLAEA